jgi:hypothetical protein
VSGDHLDRQDGQDNSASNGNGTARDVEEPHQQRTEGEKDERGDNRDHDHPAAYGSLCLGIKVFGLFEERHERNFWAHPDEQKQKEFRHQFEIDD